jgi:bisanhydrobacterioruberin hydratase
MTTKKIVIIAGFALFIAAFFTATQPLRPEMAIVSSIFVVLFALPSYHAVNKAQGWKHGLLILGALGFYALLIESSAIHTGFPYGDFIYNDLLGEKVFGLTPWTVAFAWPPILLLSYWFARSCTRTVLLRKTLKTSALTAVFAMAVDLVLDPAAVHLGFWNWREPGFFYGVPLINFLGWLLSCFIGAVILHYLWGKKKVPVGLAYSGIAILWFWTIANLFMVQIIPALVGLILLGVLFKNFKNAHTM